MIPAVSVHEAGAIPYIRRRPRGWSPSVMGAVMQIPKGLSISIDSLSPQFITTEEEVVISGTIRSDSPTTLASVSVDVFVANETPSLNR